MASHSKSRRPCRHTDGEASPSASSCDEEDEAASRQRAKPQSGSEPERASWDAHELRWAAFEAAPPDEITARRDACMPYTTPLTLRPQEGMVPWPPEPRPVHGLQRCSRMLSRRAAVRLALQRWHPDRFLQRFGSRLAPAERAAMLERVTALAAAVTTGRG